VNFVKSVPKNIYSIPILIFPIAGLLLWLSFQQRNVGTALLALFFFFIGILPLTDSRNSLLLLSSVMLSLAVGEWAVKMFDNQEAGTYSPESDFFQPAYWEKSDLGYQALPGKYRSKKLTEEGNTLYDVVYSIGSDRFRITPIRNGLERLRINFFGCSFLFGEGLNDYETLPAFLNAMDSTITVKNFGWHGYGVHQALRILESDRDTRGEINFLLTAPWHSERSACVPEYSIGSPKYTLAEDGSVHLDGACNVFLHQQFFLTRILNRSRLYQLVMLAFNNSQDRQIELYLAIIKRIKELSEERNQTLLIGFIGAETGWFTGTYSNEKIVERLDRMGIDVIDVSLVSPDNLPRQYYIHPLDKHPSTRANEARAKLVKEYLESHPSYSLSRSH
jgi:hypothetical protein